MKKIIVTSLLLIFIILGFYLIENNTPRIDINDSDYYSQLFFEEGSEQFKKALNFLLLTEEKIKKQDIKFFLYEKDNRRELHASLSGNDGNCNIHARELFSNQELFQNVAFVGSLLDIANNSETHSCSGNPCSSCRFTRSGGSISGCSCRNLGGHCNHTVTVDIQ